MLGERQISSKFEMNAKKRKYCGIVITATSKLLADVITILDSDTEEDKNKEVLMRKTFKFNI